MIVSTWRITFDPGGPLQTVLLDYGDRMADELQNAVQQDVQDGSALFAAWGYSMAQGGARRGINWTRRKTYSTLAACRTAYLLDGDLLPWNANGTLRIETADGLIVDYPDAAVASAAPSLPICAGFAVQWSFSARASRALLKAGGTQSQAVPYDWLYTAWDAMTFTWN